MNSLSFACPESPLTGTQTFPPLGRHPSRFTLAVQETLALHSSGWRCPAPGRWRPSSLVPHDWFRDGPLTQCEPMSIRLGCFLSTLLGRTNHSLAPGISKPIGGMQGATGDGLPLCGFLRMKFSEWKMDPREGERHFSDGIVYVTGFSRSRSKTWVFPLQQPKKVPFFP